MNKITFIILALIFVYGAGSHISAAQTALPSTSVVISQFQTAGGAAGDEFIEIHNVSTNSVDLNGHRLVYRSTAGTNDVGVVIWSTSTIIPAGGYYLVASTAYDGTVTPDITYNTASVGLAAAGGGLAIRNGAANTGTIIDSVGYGTATNAFIEGTVTTAPAANSGQQRLQSGCRDTDNNSTDFANLNPSLPRNTSTQTIICVGGNILIGFPSASPNPATPGGTVLFTVFVTPANNPPSTGIAVVGNLTPVGGSAAQPLFDDGTNGDVTPGDNTFSFAYQIPANQPGGSVNLQFGVSDQQGRASASAFNFVVNASFPPDEPLLFGNPSNAVPDVNQPLNYLMVKPQYTLSYNRDNATPNWVAWRLDSTWLGTAPRQDDYRPDPDLPAGWYRVVTGDYSGSGYTRGHITPSGDRTRSIPDNSATFLMTNFVPQSAANNNGTWNEMEIYLRTLAQAGNEIYTYSGGAGSLGRIGSGCGTPNSCVNVPAVTWKIALVIPNGDNDLQRVNKTTRVISVIVPNTETVNIDWRLYRVSVDRIESLTGYNFFTNLSRNTERILESRVDTQ